MVEQQAALHQLEVGVVSEDAHRSGTTLDSCAHLRTLAQTGPAFVAFLNTHTGASGVRERGPLLCRCFMSNNDKSPLVHTTVHCLAGGRARLPVPQRPPGGPLPHRSRTNSVGNVRAAAAAPWPRNVAACLTRHFLPRLCVAWSAWSTAC